MNNQISVRLAQETDVELFMMLRLEFLKKGLAVVSTDEIDGMAPVIRQYFLDNNGKNCFTFFAFDANGEAAGCGTWNFFFRPPYPGNKSGIEGYISNVYVREQFRRRGIASQIMNALADDARARGVEKVILHATDTGKKVYEKLGYKAEEIMTLKL